MPACADGGGRIAGGRSETAQQSDSTRARDLTATRLGVPDGTVTAGLRIDPNVSILTVCKRHRDSGDDLSKDQRTSLSQVT